jgi:leader peptidase (prepilin peptidase) / N-methyltransferase
MVWDDGITVFLVAYLGLVGLLLGSFINLAADRVPRRESVISPRSHCRSCGRVLNAVDLLPVAGYLIRGGRCATCGVGIGIASPAVEATCGALMLGPVLVLGVWPGALAGLALIATFGASATVLASRRGLTGSGIN